MMTKKQLILKMHALKNKDAMRLLAATLAFDPSVRFAPGAREAMMAIAINVPDVQPLFLELARNGIGEVHMTLAEALA